MGEGGICAPRDDIDGMGAKVYQKWYVLVAEVLSVLKRHCVLAGDDVNSCYQHNIVNEGALLSCILYSCA
jgi:hypothetical protein